MKQAASAALILVSLAIHCPGASAPAPAPPLVAGAGPLPLGFDTLSNFPYKIVDSGTGAKPEEIALARKTDQIPAAIRTYEGRRIALTGYMMPLQVENGLSKKFVMMKDVTTCCYGAVPNMNDYIVVTMKGAGVKAVQDVPVVLVGVLHIAEKYEGGYVVSLYEMDGESFSGPKK